jgi:hypothetical protein
MRKRRNGNFNRNSQYPTASSPPIIDPADGRVVPIEPHHARQNGDLDSVLSGKRPRRSGVRRVDFLEVSDGTLADLVRDANDPEQLRFLTYRNGVVAVQRKVTDRGKVFRPPRVRRSLVSAIKFPAMAEGNPTARGLLDGLGAAFAPYLSLQSDQLFLLAAYILATWFIDCVKVAPVLFVSGPMGADLESPLRLLGACCRRALRVKSISSGSLYPSPGNVRPTLLIDNHEGDPQGTRAAKEILRLDDGPENFSVRNSEAYQLHFAKVLCSRYPPSGFNLSRKGIEILVPFDPPATTLLDEAGLQRIVNEFVPQLFMYRLRNYHRVLNRRPIKMKDLSPATKELANAWGAPVLGDKCLLKKLLGLLGEHDRRLLREREVEPEWLVVRALLYASHHEMGESLLVGQLSSIANSLGKMAGGSTLPDRAVGALLRSVGFAPDKRTRHGWRIPLNETAKERIHSLALKYGITRGHILNDVTVDAGYGGPPCALCESIGLNTSEEGKPLKCVDLYMPNRGPGLGGNPTPDNT